jgi:hypothetical protein
MRSCLYLSLIIALVSSVQAQQRTETITSSKTVITSDDYSEGIPEYYIPDGAQVSINMQSALEYGYLFISKTSFRADTNNPAIGTIAAWTYEKYSELGAKYGSARGTTVRAASSYVGPLYLLILPDGWGTNGLTPSNYFTLALEKQGHTGFGGSTAAVNPNTAVVIPSTVNGDVEVVLEQSQDGVTWTQCLPGTYNASTVKRFFRLRAVEK